MALVEPLRSDDRSNNNPSNMTAATSSTDIKAELLRLMKRKDDLEAELSVVASNARHGEPLVDAEGFPRADVDVYTMTHDRQHATRLQNDHKQLMSQIEKLMHQLHAQNKNKPHQPSSSTPAQKSTQQQRSDASASKPASAAQSSPASTSTPKAPTATFDTTAPAPSAADGFYVVNSIVADSPASQSGLKTGDKIIEFGSVTKINWSAAAISALVQSSVGRDVHVRVYRLGEGVKELRLVPQQNWGGRGLLGCHLVEC
jgi:26S proteasome regulatory subunit N4